MEPKWNYTSRWVRCGDILEKCKLGMGSNYNYLQTERSSRWSGWRELDSHSTPDSQIKIILCNINWFNQVTKNFMGLFHLNLILSLSPKVTLIYFLPYRLLQYQNSVNNKIIFTTLQVISPPSTPSSPVSYSF